MSVHNPERLLVTGGAGFIGVNFVRFMLDRYPDLQLWNLDKLTYAGNLASLAGVDRRHGAAGGGRYQFIRGDVADFELTAGLLEREKIGTVVHFAAESHVDRSILGPEVFITTNLVGTFRLLEACRKVWAGSRETRFHHVSTDEVYGSLSDGGYFTEFTPYDPSSPYSASKAGSDHLVRAWHRTYGLNVTISNCSNNYGPFQFPEKLIPLVILNCFEGKPLPVYGQGANVRDWLYVLDHCAALDIILRRGETGRTYNVGGHGERRNLAMVETICDLADELGFSFQNRGNSRRLITFVQDRPGHDFRYAIDATRLQTELGWQPQTGLEEGLRQTMHWYRENREWCRQVQSGEYRQYYDQWYGGRLAGSAGGPVR